jgi:hypothetical protein
MEICFMTALPHRCVMTILRSSLLAFAGLGIVLPAASTARAQAPGPGPLGGMTVSSYSMNATASGRTTSSLSFNSTQNGSFDGSYIAGLDTGDGLEADTGTALEWSLQATAVDFGPAAQWPNPLNFVGLSLSSPNNFSIGDTLSGTFTLTFSDTQAYAGLNTFFDIDTSSFSTVTATLTPSGGTAENLLTKTVGTTLFPAGTYTLSLAGTLGTTLSDVSLYTVFEGPQPVPEPSTFALGGAGFACAAWGMYRRRRRARDRSMELPQQLPS